MNKRKSSSSPRREEPWGVAHRDRILISRKRRKTRACGRRDGVNGTRFEIASRILIYGRRSFLLSIRQYFIEIVRRSPISFFIAGGARSSPDEIPLFVRISPPDSEVKFRAQRGQTDSTPFLKRFFIFFIFIFFLSTRRRVRFLARIEHRRLIFSVATSSFHGELTRISARLMDGPLMI